MSDDPVIAAVREVRHRISESVDHDPYRLVAYYRRRRERPMRLQPPGGASGDGAAAPTGGEEVG